MSDVKYYFFNYMDQASTEFTASTANAQYPVSNLKEPHSTRVWRSTASSANVVIDIKTIEAIDSVLIRPSKDGFGFTGDLTIEGNATANFSSPAFSTTLAVNRERNLGLVTFASAQSYRFWRISGTGTGYLELANIYLGAYFIAGKNVSFNWDYENKDLSDSTTNRYGQEFIDEIGNRKFIAADVKLLENADGDIETFNDFIDYVGTTKPFWIIMDEDALFSPDKEFFGGQFYFTSRPTIKNVLFAIYDSSMRLKECI